MPIDAPPLAYFLTSLLSTRFRVCARQLFIYLVDPSRSALQFSYLLWGSEADGPFAFGTTQFTPLERRDSDFRSEYHHKLDLLETSR